MKLEFPGSVLGCEAFADYESTGGGAGESLLVYIGGAISGEEYARRADGRPERFLRLWESVGAPVRALVLSTPPTLRGEVSDVVGPFLRHVTEELLPSLPTAPAKVGIVGYSYGAMLATLLARHPSWPVTALATIAAVGASEATICPGHGLARLRCPVAVCYNREDDVAHYSNEFLLSLLSGRLRPAILAGSGGHDFSDYLENGLAASALRFVLEKGELVPPDALR